MSLLEPLASRIETNRTHLVWPSDESQRTRKLSRYLACHVRKPAAAAQKLWAETSAPGHAAQALDWAQEITSIYIYIYIYIYRYRYVYRYIYVYFFCIYIYIYIYGGPSPLLPPSPPPLPPPPPWFSFPPPPCRTGHSSFSCGHMFAPSFPNGTSFLLLLLWFSLHRIGYLVSWTMHENGGTHSLEPPKKATE